MMSNWNRLRVNLQARVSSLFYTHGLLVSSHPIFIITLVIGIVLFTCYPLTKLPLPGNAPQQFSTPVKDYESPSYVPPVNEDIKMPRWYLGPPVAYVQQLVFKGTVSPWQHGRLIISDAFRAPLHQVFDLIEQLNNFQYMENDNQTSGTTLTDICIHAPGLVNRPKLQGVLPEYGCMVLSPANFWGKDKNKFSADPEIINTIYKKYEKGLETQPTVRDLLFGLSMGDSAVNKYSFRNRQRIITYTVTIMVKKYDNKFISALKKKLLDLYPLSQKTNSSHIDYIVHIHDKEFNYFVEYTPLLLSYVVLFLYLYFSVRKIEMVKSKWGLALSAVCTVIASLVMSVGICALFGLTPSLSGSEIFPYLVIIVGLENVLVVTKSVVSTPVHLDVKLRVAKGISKEGWYIFKNLTTELAILTVGFFTFVPAIQEFCLFAVVGLLSDFFLQMFFYTTVLSIDIRRMELSDLHRQSVQRAIQEVSDEVGQQPVAQCPFQNNFNIAPEYHTQLARSQSAPRLNVAELQQQQHAPGYPSISGSDVGSSEAHTCNVTEDDQSIARTRSCNVPRRLQVFNFFAKAKLAQRGLMAFLIIWIVLVVYKTGLIEHFTDSNVTEKFLPSHPQPQSATLERLMGRDYVPNQADPSISEDRALLGGDPSLSEDGIFPVEGISEVDDLAGQALVQHKVLESWRSLSHLHWNTLLGHYNQSVRNRYISILPSIHLSMLISPEHAVNIRHPDEQQHSTSEDGSSHLNTHFTSDMLNAHHGQTEKIIQTPQHLNLTTIIHRLTTYPQSGSDWIWLVVFAIATVILLFYLMINLYRCLCSRNYARWRRNALKGGSRMGRGKNVKTHRRTGSGYYKQIRESMPLILNGHTQVIECLITDGPLIISSCLGGHIFVWDSMNGERISTIQRQCAAPLSPRTPAPGRNINDSEADLYAEFHEDTLSDAVYKGHRGSLSPSGSIGTLNSSIEARGSTDSHLHRRPHSADYSNLAPDLSNTIMTDFIDMGKDNIINTNTGNSSGHSSATSGSSGNIEDSSKLNTGGESVELPDSDGGPMVIGSRSVSESDSGGYDFSRFDSLYEEHESDMCELRSLNMKRAEMARQASDEGVGSKDRTFSCGSTAESICSVGSDGSNTATCTSPIWCLTSRDNLIITGCGDGRIEMWDAFTGLLRCVYHISKVGVVGLCFIRNKVIAARLNGYLDFLELETFANINREPTTHRTAFTRTDSSSQLDSMRCWPEVIHCTLLSSTRAHQQAITVVKAEAGRVVTGSQDHTLKVFRLEDLFCLYTLHGHKGSITTLFLDSIAPLSAASGSNDGSVRLWDLLTGACVHKFEGHGQGHSVTSLLCTDSYVISSGTDDRLYVWERCKGNLLHWLQMNPGFCHSMAMLTSHLMVSGGQGCLYMWDISKGKILRAVPLGDHGDSVYVNDICVIDHTTVICDYGHQLRVIHFPSVLEKSD